MKPLRAFLPILEWLPDYQRAWLRTDLMAGLAVWAMTVPQALAYAGIANVPAVYGLYSVPLAMIAYTIFGTSRTLSVGPESAIAIISAVTVGALVVGEPDEFLALTALLTLIVAIFPSLCCPVLPRGHHRAGHCLLGAAFRIQAHAPDGLSA